jgi:hypothetical protein
MAGRSGLNWLAGGAAAAILVPVLALGPGLPFWIACIASALAGGGLVILLAPATRFKALDASGVARGKIAFARELLTEADPFISRLEAAAKAIRAKTAVDRVRHLASVARHIRGSRKRPAAHRPGSPVLDLLSAAGSGNGRGIPEPRARPRRRSGAI